MTPSRLATATLLLAGLALPALAQGTATAVTAAPVTGGAVAGKSMPAAPGDATARATPEGAKAGTVPEARTHAEATPAHGAMHSHRRLASASRMDRVGTTHTTSGEVAPATTR